MPENSGKTTVTSFQTPPYCFDLFDQQSKPQSYSVYKDIKTMKRKKNPAKSREWVKFLLENKANPEE